MIDHRTEMLLKAITYAIFIAALLLLGFAMFKDVEPLTTFKDAEPVTKFKVVDQYEGCQVIRYTDPSNRWNYLLKCT